MNDLQVKKNCILTEAMARHARSDLQVAIDVCRSFIERDLCRLGVEPAEIMDSIDHLVELVRAEMEERSGS